MNKKTKSQQQHLFHSLQQDSLPDAAETRRQLLLQLLQQLTERNT